MMMFSSPRTAILVASATLLSAGAQAGLMPTNMAAMKSMVDQNTTEVRWGGGWRGGGIGYRGGGWGYRGLGYGLAAGAILGGAVASRGYYGSYGGYYGGDPYDSYAAILERAVLGVIKAAEQAFIASADRPARWPDHRK